MKGKQDKIEVLIDWKGQCVIIFVTNCRYHKWSKYCISFKRSPVAYFKFQLKGEC